MDKRVLRPIGWREFADKVVLHQELFQLNTHMSRRISPCCGAYEDEKDDLESGVVVRTRDVLAPPPMYKVWMHNDDFTPMDFVVSILVSIFHMDPSRANEVMLDVHRKGIGLCGIYPFDIAETKVSQVLQEAKAKEYPLKCTFEAE
ncbi:MAG: ATP-dependent Clp protease adapter ClpS [Zetaproteobacteria bacterium]|nr:ATP-dependent Clp protease adapter ClpS [Zetaproteobacteria bacterium]